ncbi:MAG: LOG family protein [Anaerolineae bacterium]
MDVISIFGSARPQPGSAAYEQARAVGRLLAEAGLAVATGGYGGTMSGASQGAAEAGGHVIGVASTRIEQFRSIGVNPWVKEVVHYETLTDRLLHLVKKNNGMIALPGGIGTLSELTLAWSFLQVGEIEPRPFAVIGDKWREAIQGLYDAAYFRADDMKLLHFVESAEEAVAFVRKNVKQAA